MVTHYAEPIGYIFARDDLQRAGGSDSPGCARPAAAWQAARRTDCAGVSGFAAGHFQAPSAAAPGASGRGAAGGKAPVLPAQSRTIEGSGFLVRAISLILASTPNQLEGVCRGRAGERVWGVEGQA